MKMKGQNLKKAGLKVTIPRLQVLKYLEKHPSTHFTVNVLLKKLRSRKLEIGYATIYRILNQFENAGLVVKHQFDNDQSVYEINTGDHHDHMVDVETGEVIEFFDKKLEALQVKLAKKHGYKLIDHNMVLYVKKIT